MYHILVADIKIARRVKEENLTLYESINIKGNIYLRNERKLRMIKVVPELVSVLSHDYCIVRTHAFY